LAIELAACQSKGIAPEQMLRYLNNRLALLVGGPRDRPTRHQSLQAAIDWSYALLSQNEQKLFRWLGVFQGGCTSEAVEAVCASADEAAQLRADVNLLQLLASLQDKNLLQRSLSGGTTDKFRYSMLETILEYAGYQLLKSGEADEAQQRHLAWCVQLAEQASRNLRGPDQLLWLNQLDEELNNLRKALLWCVEHPVAIESGLRIAADLHWFWRLRSRISEGREWLDRLLAIDLPSEASRSARQAQAQAISVAASLHALLGNRTRAMELTKSCLQLFEEIGDQSGVVSAKVQLSVGIFRSGNVYKGVALAEEVLVMCRTIGDRFNEAELLDGPLSGAALIQGDYARAIALHEQALALRRALHDMDGEAWSLYLLAGSVLAHGDTQRAKTLLEKSCALWRQLGSWRWYASALDELGRVVYKRGNYAQAQILFEECLATAQRIYDPYWTASATCDLARAACTARDYTRAKTLIQQIAVHIDELVKTPVLAMFLISAALLASLTGREEHAARLAGAAQLALRNANFLPATSDKAEFESAWSAVRAAVNTDLFDRACAEGQAMSLETACAYATHEDRN
jgi:non-specific serine/threonine protein kinase